ncbi:Hypothetical protein A7982_05638 [Minicystis rosea]|nr:Hypothetical protein A7982_05638 [Minicystis rosea]
MNVSTVAPWELNPVLKRERLILLARQVAETRNKVFAEADREAGDTNWGLACRAHERLGHALVRLAEDGKHPWLTVSREGLYLMPRIEGVPVRAYRGAPDRPASKHLDALRAETTRHPPKQTMFSFMDAADQDGPWFWLMALETDESGQIARVTYLQANEAHETRHAWTCPLDEEPVEVPERKRAAPPKSATRAVKPAPIEAPPTIGLDFTRAVPFGNEAPAAMHAV